MSTPYDYYPAVLYAIDRLAEGRTMTAACDAANITVTTFEAYVNRSPELQQAANEAIQRGYDAMAEALLEPDNHRLYGHTDSKMAGVQQKAIMWFLSKKRPKEYGERVQVDVNITADKAITDALLAGRQRALLAAPVIDAEFSEMPTLTPSTNDVDEDAAIMAEIMAGMPS